MDGLKISTAEGLINTGKTISQQSVNSFKEEMAEGSEVNSKSFSDTLKDVVNQVNELQKDADVKMQKFASGESKNIPEVMIATEKADIALKLMVQVRNKIIDAYQEIIKMQV